MAFPVEEWLGIAVADRDTVVCIERSVKVAVEGGVEVKGQLEVEDGDQEENARRRWEPEKENEGRCQK